MDGTVPVVNAPGACLEGSTVVRVQLSESPQTIAINDEEIHLLERMAPKLVTSHGARVCFNTVNSRLFWLSDVLSLVSLFCSRSFP